MKKLTAGIFATILGVTAMGAADAAIPSKGYVDAAVKGVADSVTTLGTTVSDTYATKEALTAETNTRTSQDTTLQGNIDELAGKVGTIPSTATATTVVGYVDEKTANIASDATVSALDDRVQVIEGDYLKAAALTPYAKTADVDAELELKATKAELADYAKTSALTSGLAGKVDNATLNDYATTTAAQGYAATAKSEAIAAAAQDAAKYIDADELAAKGYATTSALTSGLAEKQATLVGDQLDAVNSGITAAKISNMNQATATAQAAAEAAQGTADSALTKANTNAGAITNLEAFDNSIKTASADSVDGTYTLTMKKTGDAMTFGWELIQRDANNQ